MSNSFGHNIKVTLFGESHGPAIGVVIDGLTPGMVVDEEVIKEHLTKRRPSSPLDTPRQEKDNFTIVSGAFNQRATGTPLTIVIPNENVHSSDYSYGVARPSHADYAAYCRYGGFEDYRGGGHFSGRITAGLVAAGGILIPALNKKGIFIKSEIVRCGNALKPEEFDDEIIRARESKDSVGGITKTVITGLPAGVGEPWFDSVEGLIAHGIYSIGGIKGIEFGDGFEFGSGHGSTHNDAFYMEGDHVAAKTNHNGGINGGITNGMPVVFRCAVKPTPSISQPQETVNFLEGRDCITEIRGRHDPAIIRRICPVIDAVTSMAIADLLVGRFGSDFLLG